MLLVWKGPLNNQRTSMDDNYNLLFFVYTETQCQECIKHGGMYTDCTFTSEVPVARAMYLPHIMTTIMGKYLYIRDLYKFFLTQTSHINLHPVCNSIYCNYT